MDSASGDKSTTRGAEDTKASGDAYAAEHMAAGSVLIRDKRVAGRTYQLLSLVPGSLLALAALGCVAAALVISGAALPALLGGAAGAALLAAMFGAMWVTGTVIRAVVTRDELHVQAGLFGPRIPIQRIKSCRVGEQHSRLRTGVRFEDGMWTRLTLRLDQARLTFGNFGDAARPEDDLPVLEETSAKP